MSLPSPAASPSSKVSDLDVGATRRKRQRSESMQSDSSSLKRAASEGPTTVRATHDAPAQDLSNDIDAYMADQGEDALNTVTLIPPPTPPHEPPANLNPEQKLDYVSQRRTRQMQVGDTWYIVSRVWYRRWEVACQGIVDKSGPVEEKDIGPVDNTPLVDRDGNLVSNLAEGVDVEFVPWDVWKALTTWCVSDLCPPLLIQPPPGMDPPPTHCLVPSLREVTLANLASNFALPASKYLFSSTPNQMARLALPTPTSPSLQRIQ